MPDFFSKPAAQPTPTPDMSKQKEAIIQQIQQETAISNAQVLVDKMNSKCFARCVTKPSTDLSNSEEGCISRCVDRYMEAYNIVSRAYLERLARERVAETRRQL